MRITALTTALGLPYGEAPLPRHAEPAQRPAMKEHEFADNPSAHAGHTKSLREKELRNAHRQKNATQA